MNKKNLAKIIIFPLLVATTLVCLDEFFFEKTNQSDDTITNYVREKKNTLDMTFLGSSTTWYGIIPTEFYKETNITARTIAKAPYHPALYPETLEYIYDNQQNTSFMYIDIVGCFYLEENVVDAFAKDLYISFPKDSKYRKKLVKKYPSLKSYVKVDEKNLDNSLFKYHNNFRRTDYWANISVGDHDFLKGYRLFNCGTPQTVVEVKKQEKDLSVINPDGFKFLNDLLDITDTHKETKFIFARTARQICTETEGNLYTNLFEWTKNYIQNVRVKNNPNARTDYIVEDFALDADEIGINEKEDMKDDCHLNVKGARKFTKYLSDFAKKNLDLSNLNHDQETKEKFDEAYKKTEEYIDLFE